MMSPERYQQIRKQPTDREKPTRYASGPGDIGRRVMQRRTELGLNREEVASRAAMAPEYVQHLEEQPSAVGLNALVHLAHALETTTAALLGGGVDSPPGPGGAGHQPRLEDLGAMECQKLLASGGVGRVVFVSARGPVAYPVNYQLDGDDVVFRTEAFGGLAGIVDSGTVSFEADHVDNAMSEGWSVLMTGYARVVEDSDERARLQRMAVDPWAGGERSMYLRLVPVEMTGRRIRAGR